MPSRRWSSSTKAGVIVALVLLAIWSIVVFRAMIPSTIVALLLAFTLGYPVNWIQQRTGWARTPAIVLLYVAILFLVLLMPVLVLPRILGLANSLQQILVDLIDNLQTAVIPLGSFRIPVNDLFV